MILYADTVTDSIRLAMEETARRREKQEAFNEAHGIVPRGIIKKVQTLPVVTKNEEKGKKPGKKKKESGADQRAVIAELYQEMQEAAARLDFETAAVLRDRIRSLEE